MFSANGYRGFTLLEILVALAMLSLVCLSMAASSGRAVDNAGYLKERTLATWVAMNKAAEIQLAKKWIPTSTADGESEMAGRKWQWKVTGYETPDEDIRRGIIEVRKETDDEEPLSSLTIFLGRPSGS